MTKKEHFERWVKQVKPNMPLDYNEQEGYFYHDMVSFAYQAWVASPKTLPTEKGKITKEQLAAMKADTTNIVDHLRGIYQGAVSPYPVSPLQKKAADLIEGLQVQNAELVHDNARMYESLTAEVNSWTEMEAENTKIREAASQAHSLLGELLAEASGGTEKEIYRVFDLLRFRLGIYDQRMCSDEAPQCIKS